MITAGPHDITTKGLVLHLDAGDVRSYPGSGNTWYDLSPKANHATTDTPPTWTTNTDGRPVMRFSGSGFNEYYQTQNDSAFSGNQFALTAFAVISQTSRSGSLQSMISQNPVDGLDGLSLFSYAGRIATDHWSAGGRYTSTYVIPVATTCMIAWRIPLWADHQYTAELYLNNVEQASAVYSEDVTGSLLAKPFIIGNWQISRDDMDFHGDIEKIWVYDRELTDSEMDLCWNTQRKRFGL